MTRSAAGRWSALALVLLVAFAFAPGVRNGFVTWDDVDYIRENPLLHDVDGLRRIWLTLDAPQYYPLTFTTYWCEYHLWGARPTGYYLVNVALHAATCLLVPKLARRLGLSAPAAFFAAALFALHPLQVASVAWLAERKNVLSGVFALATFLLYLRHRRTGTAWPYGLSLLTFAAGLLSKTAIMPLPLSLLAADWWILRKRGWGGVGRIMPMLLLSIAAGLVTVLAEHEQPLALPDARGRPFAAAAALWFYLKQIMLPVHLPALYPKWTIDPQAPRWWLPILALVAVLLLGWLLRKRLSGLTLWGSAHFVLMLAPMLGLIPFGYLNYAPVADHFVYLAILGPLLIVSRWLDPWLAGSASIARHAIRLAAGAVILLAGARSFEQVPVWRDGGTLWSYTLRYNPGSAVAHTNLGLVLEDQGKPDAAFMHYLAAVRLDPHYAEAHSNVASIYSRRGDLDTALRHAAEAVRLEPGLAEALNNLGSILAQRGQVDEAIPRLQRAIVIKPKLADAHSNLGAALLRTGEPDEAIVHLRTALDLNDRDAATHVNLANALVDQRKYTDALPHYERALKLAPGWINAEINLARLLAVWPEATPDQARRAVALAEHVCTGPDGDNPWARDILGMAYAAAGRFDDALRAAQQARAQASAIGQPQLAQDIDERLRAYRVGRPARLP